MYINMSSRISSVNNVNKHQVVLNWHYNSTHIWIFGMNTSKFIIIIVIFDSLNTYFQILSHNLLLLLSMALVLLI